MGIYLYRALTQDGREVSGSLEYAEERAVLAYLEAQGYIPVEIALGREGSGGAFEALPQRPITHQQETHPSAALDDPHHRLDQRRATAAEGVEHGVAGAGHRLEAEVHRGLGARRGEDVVR